MIDIDKDKNKIRQDLKNMLLSYGYTLSETDNLIDILIPKTIQSLKNLLNRKDVPDELYYVFLCRTIGDFLNIKYSTNNLNIEKLNFEPVLASLTEGKVSMSFKGDTVQETFSNVVSKLLRYGENELYHYREIGW